MRTGAVIVAAGMSSRMKAFKPLLALGSSTIIGTAIATLRSAGVEDIVTVTGHESEKLEEYLSALDVTCLYNENYQSTDMLYSAKMGLNYLKDKCGRVFFLPADAPLFSKQSLASMSKRMDFSDIHILSPVHAGKMGHPILIDSGAIPYLAGYEGIDGLKGAIERYSGKKELIELDDFGMTLDADRPEDYELLKTVWRRNV